MMSPTILGVLMLVLVFYTGHAQTYILNSITVSGNDKTESFVIEREFNVHPGDTVSFDDLAYVRDRIYSLELFTDVSISIAPADKPDHINVIYEVVERWHWYGYPLVRFRGGTLRRLLDNPDPNDLNYGFRIIHRNLFGRKTFVRLHVETGSETDISALYSNPNSFFDPNWTFSVFGSYTKKILESDSGTEVDQKTTTSRSFLIGTGRRFSPYFLISGSLQYRLIEILESETDGFKTGLNKAGEADQLYGFSLSTLLDTRNSVDYTTNGFQWTTQLINYLESNTGFWYTLLNIDARSFIPLDDQWTMAGQMVMETAIGNHVPYYDYYFLGNDQEIRGYQQQVIPSKRRVLMKGEFRYVWVEPRTDHQNWMPFKEFQDWRWGLYLSFFTDLGILFNVESRFTDDRNLFIGSSGFGFNMTLPYSLFLKTEYAVTHNFDQTIWLSGGKSF